MEITIHTLHTSQGWKLNQVKRNGKTIAYVVAGSQDAKTFGIDQANAKAKAVKLYTSKTGVLSIR